MKRLYKAGGMVERDALIARLRSLDIDAITPERDTSRKVTETTIDLSLGGYSAIADGFAVFVPEAQFDQAEAALAEFLREARANPEAEINYWQKYYACSLFSLSLPFVMNVFATYHLVKAVKTQGPPTNRLYFALASVCYLASWSLVGFVVLNYFGLA